MVSPDVEIAELNYHIRRKQTELEHGQKYLKHRQKTGLISDFDENEANQQQTRIESEIEELKRQIRQIENKSLRTQNLKV